MAIDARSKVVDFRCVADLPCPGGDPQIYHLFRAKSAESSDEL